MTTNRPLDLAAHLKDWVAPEALSGPISYEAVHPDDTLILLGPSKPVEGALYMAVGMFHRLSTGSGPEGSRVLISCPIVRDMNPLRDRFVRHRQSLGLGAESPFGLAVLFRDKAHHLVRGVYLTGCSPVLDAGFEVLAGSSVCFDTLSFPFERMLPWTPPVDATEESR